MITFDTRKNGAVPFWFWNGDQQEGELTRQLELAAAAGLKGMAIHARKGNQTDYMSDRDPLDTCVQHGEYYLARFGMQGPGSRINWRHEVADYDDTY